MELWQYLVIFGVVFVLIGVYKSNKKTSVSGTALASAVVAPLHGNSLAAQPTQPVSYAFLDLETTGLNPETDRITEICVFIVTVGQASHDGKGTLINPGRPIPSHIVELTGITDEMVRNEPTEECLHEYFNFIGDRQVFAYNADFDIRFLRAAATRLGRSFPNEGCCIMERLRKQHPDLRSYKLGDACDAFGVTVEGSAHRAEGDVKRALFLWNAINTGKAPSSGHLRASHAYDDYSVYGHFNAEGACFYVWTARREQPKTPENDPLWLFYVTESLKGQYEVRLLEEGVSFADAQADKEALLKKHADTVLNRANPWRKPNYKQMDRSQALKKEIESSLVTAKTIEKSDPVAALVLHQKSLQLAEDQLNLLLEGGLFGEVEREFAKRNRCGLMLKVLDRIILLLCKEMRFQEANLIATNLFERYPYARDMSGAEAIHKRISKGLAKGQKRP